MKPEEIEIILVEDNVDDAFFTKRAFEEANAENHMIILKNGEDAINYFFNKLEHEHRAFDGHPKLILLDLHLPKVDGLEILEQLKSHEATRKIPVVILTATDDDPTMKKALEMGAESYIVKPVTFAGFVEVVEKLDDKWL